MRTTLDIEGPVLKQLKELQKREGGTLGSLASRLIADALARKKGASATKPFVWHSQPMHATVDLADKDAVYAILDRPDRAAEP